MERTQGAILNTLTRDLTLRIGGESGEGIVTTGEVLARIAAFAGLEVYTVRTIPAEIKGGHVMFQMRAGRDPVHSQGDELDILLAFNQEAYDNHHGDLREGGILIYDNNELTVAPRPGEVQYALPLTRLAKSIEFMRGKNIVAIGVLVKIFGLPYDKAKIVVERQLGKRGGDLLAKNLQALELGYKYAEENIAGESSYDLGQPEGEHAATRLVMSGNTAFSIGALAAGCSFYAGYPITPASDIMEFLALELPRVGGVLIQAEDEMAALAMATGAAFSGARSMTATSGPGLDLMIELLGHASMTETPVVIVDVQRGGPSTGLPTKVSQGDLFLAVFGGHDDFPRIVVAPLSVEDCFYAAIDAFNLAEKYQMPVIVLSDFGLSNRVETIPAFDMTRAKRMERVTWKPNGDHAYKRYQVTESGVSPMSIPGTVGGSYTAEGLEHDETGAPDYTPERHTQMMEKRFRKIRTASDDIKKWPNAIWRYGDSQPEVGIVGWGSTSGPVKEAIDRARAEGMKVGAFFPRFLSPLPEAELGEFLGSLKAVIVPELNYRGQLADIIQARYCIRIDRLNKFNGQAFTAGDIYRKLAAVYSEWVVPVGV